MIHGAFLVCEIAGGRELRIVEGKADPSLIPSVAYRILYQLTELGPNLRYPLVHHRILALSLRSLFVFVL